MSKGGSQISNSNGFGKKVSSYFNPNTQLKRGALIGGKIASGGKTDVVIGNMPGMEQRLAKKGIKIKDTSHSGRGAFGTNTSLEKGRENAKAANAASRSGRGAFGTNTSLEKGRENAKAANAASRYADKSIRRLAFVGQQNKIKRWAGEKYRGSNVEKKISTISKNRSIMAARNSKVGQFFGKQGKRAHGEYKSFTSKPSKYVFNKQSKAAKFGLKATKAMAISNLNAAAEIQVNDKGIFAVFKPIFWGCKLGALAMSNAYPVLITGLIFGIFLATWLFGLISGYYAIHFLRSLPAVVVNVFLTIGNAVYFAIIGLFNLLVLGITTIINAMFNFFVGPLYGLADAINLFGDVEMPTLSWSFTLQPTQGFCYLRPNPMETTGDLGGMLLSFFSYSWLRPGEEPYLYDANGEMIMDPCFTQGGAKLEFPSINPDAKANFIWDDLTDKPPPNHTYNFNDPGLWGSTIKNGVWVNWPQVHFSQTFATPIVDAAVAAVAAGPTIISPWLSFF